MKVYRIPKKFRWQPKSGCGMALPMIHSTVMAFSGEGLRGLRKKKHFSQDALAARAGVNGQTISDIETGKTKRPQGETWRRIAEVLGVTLEELDAACETDEMEEAEIDASQLEWLRAEATRRKMAVHLLLAHGIRLLAAEDGKLDPRDGEHEGLDGLSRRSGRRPDGTPKKPRKPRRPDGRGRPASD